jgi:hypothetical protein
MTAEPTPLNTIQLTHQEIQIYWYEGYLVIPGLIKNEYIARLSDEIRDIMEITGPGPSKLRQTTQYLAGSVLDQLINSRELKQLASSLMGGPSTLYMPFTAVKSANGGGKFHFHQDNQYTEFDGPGINFWFALSAMSPENGCLQIVPGSHMQGTFRAIESGDGDQHKKVEEDPVDFLPLQMRPGDCVAFSRLTLHGSGANRSEEDRIAYAVQFHRDDVKARWGGDDWVLLKQKPRWPTRAVPRITSPGEKQPEGH